VTTQVIRDYTDRRIGEGAAPATVNRELAALKRMFNLGARSTPARVERVPYVPMLKEDNVRKGFFEHEEYLAVREALPEYLKDVVTFGYKTGWRVPKITGLTWGKVDLKEGSSSWMTRPKRCFSQDGIAGGGRCLGYSSTQRGPIG
jgi:integrase